MKKPERLRAAIVAALPELGRDADRLKLFIDKGRIETRATATFGFTWAYTLNVIATDYTWHPDALIVAVIAWLRDHQIELVASHDDNGFRFEADIIDAKTIDLSLELDLRENVGAVQRSASGAQPAGWNLQHFDDPVPLFADDLGLSEPAVPLASLWIDGVPLIP